MLPYMELFIQATKPAPKSKAYVGYSNMSNHALQKKNNHLLRVLQQESITDAAGAHNELEVSRKSMAGGRS